MTLWCRVRDLSTGHTFDVSEERLKFLLAKGAVVEIPGRRHTGAPHPPKPRRQKGVGPTTRRKRTT